MEKVEILAPAGSMESLVAAINKGADAVYLGGNKFSARAYASNFDNDNMIGSWDCMTTAAKEVGISNKLLWAYCKYNRKDEYGYNWRYI